MRCFATCTNTLTDCVLQLDVEEIWTAVIAACKRLRYRQPEKPEDWQPFLRSVAAFLCPKLRGGQVIFEILEVLQEHKLELVIDMAGSPGQPTAAARDVLETGG